MPEKPEDRVDRIVNDLLRGRRLKLRGGDAEEKEAITAAARLIAARQGTQRMHPAFRQRLTKALESAPTEQWLSRRAALVAGLGVAVGTLAGSAIRNSLDATGQSHVAAARPITPSSGRWVDVGALADFSEGHGQRVSAGAVGAFLFRRGDGVSAVSSICSDLPCELQWNGDTGFLDCPCHPASFTPAGHPTNSAYPKPNLNVVNVRITPAGRVEVLGT